ncbi:MAG: hypothetical protein IJA34_15070 [Lachnospiraceae bacterium]|nr:hypothetical protein [Lachnospiraceae bacterium]
MIFRRKAIIISAILIVAIIVVAYVSISREKNRVFESFEVKSSVEIDGSIETKYMKFADGMIGYTTDGISYYAGGREIFNKAISIIAPIVSVSNEYVVIGEKKSSEINLIDKNGSLSKITSTYPIVGLDVSDKGVVAAVLDDGTANYIEFYDKSGARLVSGRTVLEGDGYPIDISISDDSTRLVASYLAISEGTAQSKVVFYNYSSVGENEVDRIVGGFNQYKDTIVPEVSFINDSTVVAMGDNMFSIYNIKQKPKLIHEEKFEDKIQSVFFSENNIGIVYISNDSAYAQVLKVYDTEGKSIFSKTIDFKYNDIAFAGENVVMYDEAMCRMYSFTGKERFNYTFEKKINSLIPIKDDMFIIAGDTAIEEIELK